MASSASAPSLDRPGVERLLALLQPEHSLPLFPLPAETEDASDWRCSAFLLRTRAGGFMAAVPDTETVAEHLTTWWMRKVRRWLWFGRPTWPWLGESPALLVEGPGHVRPGCHHFPGGWEHSPARAAICHGGRGRLDRFGRRRPSRVPDRRRAGRGPRHGSRRSCSPSWPASSSSQPRAELEARTGRNCEVLAGQPPPRTGRHEALPCGPAGHGCCKQFRRAACWSGRRAAGRRRAPANGLLQKLLDDRTQ